MVTDCFVFDRRFSVGASPLPSTLLALCCWQTAAAGRFDSHRPSSRQITATWKGNRVESIVPAIFFAMFWGGGRIKPPFRKSNEQHTQRYSTYSGQSRRRRRRRALPIVVPPPPPPLPQLPGCISTSTQPQATNKMESNSEDHADAEAEVESATNANEEIEIELLPAADSTEMESTANVNANIEMESAANGNGNSEIQPSSYGDEMQPTDANDEIELKKSAAVVVNGNANAKSAAANGNAADAAANNFVDPNTGAVTVTVTKSSRKDKLGIGVAHVVLPLTQLSVIKISSISDTSIFRNTVLRVGMIILKINGKGYSDFEHGSKMLQSIGMKCEIMAAFPFPPNNNPNISILVMENAAANGAAAANADEENDGRKSYKCKKCGVPKRGHTCPYKSAKNFDVGPAMMSTTPIGQVNALMQMQSTPNPNFNFYANALMQSAYTNAVMQYAANNMNGNNTMMQPATNTDGQSADKANSKTITEKQSAASTDNGNADEEKKWDPHPLTPFIPPDRKRVRAEAVEIIAKRLRHDGDYTKWVPVDKKVAPNTTRKDSEDLQAMLFAISRSDPARAAGAIVHFLNQKCNSAIKKEVVAEVCELNDEQVLHRQIVKGLRKSLAHHTNEKGGTRTAPAEAFVKNVCTASLFHIVPKGGKIPATELTNLLGASRRQIDNAIEQVKSLVENNTTITFSQRKPRSDRKVDKIIPYIFDFLLDDEYTRQEGRKHPVEVTDPHTGEKRTIQRRSWLVRKGEDKFAQFTESQYYRAFQEAHNQTTIGMTLFCNVVDEIGTFVVNLPKPKSKSSLEATRYAQETTQFAIEHFGLH